MLIRCWFGFYPSRLRDFHWSSNVRVREIHSVGVCASGYDILQKPANSFVAEFCYKAADESL